MDAHPNPLIYGVRQAIRDSPKTTYEIGKQSKVSPQNLYRFLDEGGTRGLSQKSIDSLGLHLGLTLVCLGRADGLLRFHPPILDKTGKRLPEGTPLTDHLRRAFESSRKLVPDVAKAIDVSPTQFYRFLDGTRGLSLEKLDRLCGLMGLVVEGPPDAATNAAALRSFRKGAIYIARKKTYISMPDSDFPSMTGSGIQPRSSASTPSLYSPPADDIDGES